MINIYKAISNPLVRSDESILIDILATLWRVDQIRSIDYQSISVAVRDGEALLEGHIAREQNYRLIEDIARSVPGVVAVHNRIITDHELVIEVAKALFEDRRTRPYILPVSSFHGWVSLGGEVPTRQVQLAAEEAAGRIPIVRGVLSLPGLIGEEQGPERRAIQPQSGATVYGNDGQVGVVTQVVINPRNRLVSQVVVRASYDVEGWPVFGEYVLPAEAIIQVNAESIFLAQTSSPLSAYPVFDPSDYPFASSAWRPPYPYIPGAVRWPGEEMLEERPLELGMDIFLTKNHPMQIFFGFTDLGRIDTKLSFDG